MRNYTDLFFMGVAFLLLETMNVVRFALLFGTTWFVNSLVFAGILLAVLAAVEVARRVRLPKPGILYAVSLRDAGGGLDDPAVCSADAVRSGPVCVAATVLAFAPIFLANVVFAQRFKDVGSSTIAFGANLLGAMVGGVLEYAALIVGYRSLVIFAGLLYGLAFFFGHKQVPVRTAG